MNKKCIIELKDEVNCKIHDLDTPTRRKLQDKFSFILPHAYHVPAFKMGRWDGKVSYFTLGALTYISLLDDILPILLEDGYEVELLDQRYGYDFDLKPIEMDHFSDKVWPEGHPVAGEPVVLRDYQVKVINAFLSNPASTQEIATGAGKTLITAALSNLVEPYGGSIVIVPSKDLVTQTEEDYINLGLDVGVYFGDRKDLNALHTICTWQSLEVMQKNFKAGKSELSLIDFIDGVVLVMVDEAHGAKADVLKKMLTGPFAQIPLRWGLTGTIPPEKNAQYSIRVGLGNNVGELSASSLQDAGILANCHVDVLQMLDTVEYSNYASELTYLTTDEKRLDSLAATIMAASQTGNTLVLVDRVKAGEGLMNRLPEDRTVFVSGKMKSVDRKGHYKEIADTDNKIIVATYGVAAVGINVPRIFNMVLIEPGKSFVRVIQSIGRGLRKAQDKDFVNIYDITSTAKFSKRHLRDRKKFYKKAGYPYTITKVDWRTDNNLMARIKNKKEGLSNADINK